MFQRGFLGCSLVPEAVQKVLLAVNVKSQFLELVPGTLLLVLYLEQLLHLLDLFIPQRFYVLLHLKGNRSTVQWIDLSKNFAIHLGLNPDQLL